VAQTAIANLNDHLATRVSYKLDLRGPSLTIQDRLLDVPGGGARRLPGAR